ncbi:MAG: SGNH/GDSL hydrolase family protein, partial [Candidatus Omnitrophica bacterium]|nr:SGNH/GDSL hydrolase family protein [Candidatus Omnitrophota bacterium]
MNRRKAILFGFITVFLAIIFSIFVLGEVIFRLVKPLTPAFSMGISMGRPDPVFHHLYPANVKVEEMFAGFPTSFSTNNQGLRGKEYLLHKPKGIYRILIFGDSFVFGTAVNDNQTFCHLLEKELNSGLSNKHYEVINCGIVSYSPMLEYLFLKEKMINYAPDLVIFFYNFSDLQEDTSYARHAKYDKNGEIISCSPFYIDGHPDYVLLLRKNFYFFSYIYNKLSKSLHKIRLLGLKDYIFCNLQGKSAKELIMQKPSLRSVDLDMYFIFRENTDKNVIKYYWKNSNKWLDKTKALLDKEGIDFILVAFPHGLQVSPTAWNEGRAQWLLEKDKLYDSPVPFEMLEGYAKERNIKFLNLWPSLLA